jgi:DNA-binding SARP family transcriptional activator/predicted ATPase
MVSAPLLLPSFPSVCAPAPPSRAEPDHGIVMRNLTLTCFGHPLIELDGVPVRLSGRKPVALLAYLALTGRRHSREALAALLWPESPEALSNLRQSLWHLRQAGLEPWLSADREAVGLCAGFTFDVAAFDAAWHAGRYADAIACYRAEVLAGFTLRDAPGFDEWLFHEADRRQQMAAQALAALVDACTANGAYDAGLDYARRWLALDPLHEPAHCALMRLYALAGQFSAAIRQYELCARVLAEELNSAPDPATQELYERIRRRDDLAPVTLPAPQPDEPAAAPMTALPTAPAGFAIAHTTPLFGREAELATLTTLLGDPERRLITVVGPGGSGKTRLAYAVAARQKSRAGANAVGWIELAPLTAVEQLVPTIAAAFDLRLSAERHGAPSHRQQLIDALMQRRVLIVLDNFEHLLAGADLVAELVRAAPEVRILVTSRERLGLHGEQILALQGLELPVGAEASIAAPAAQLFVHAARRVVPDFAPAPSDLPHLVAICRLVAGLPLALELAAVWVELLSLEAIAAEIQRSLDLLATTARDLPERQRSIRAVCASAWQRLAPDQQRLFAQLALFRGGFTRAAAYAVTDATPVQLARLVHTSWLRYDRERERYTIHELLRQYAAEQLVVDSELECRTRNRHATYFCAMLERCGAELRGAQQQDAIAAIDAERENVRAAWQWAGVRLRWAELAQAADCLGMYLKWQATFAEGLMLFAGAADALAAAPELSGEPRRQLVLAQLRAWQSNFARLLGQRNQAEQILDAAAALLDDVPPTIAEVQRVRAFVLLQCGQIAHDAGRPEALHYYQSSRDACATPDTRWERSAALAALGQLAHDQGDFAEAEAQFAASLAIRQACGDQRGVAYVLEFWSQTAAEAGRPHEAEALALRSNAIYQDLGDRVSSATGLGKLGVIQMWLGAYPTARATLADSLALYQQLGNRAAVARARCRLALALSALGAFAEASAEVQTGLALARSVGKPLDLAWGQWVAGMVLLGIGALPEAEAAFTESAATYRATGYVGQVGWSVALLAHIALERDDAGTARAQLLTVLREARERRDVLPPLEALPTAARLLARSGAAERAIELLALAEHFPVLAHSHVYKTVLNQARADAAQTLAADQIAAAEARGRQLDLWTTVAALLDELDDDAVPPQSAAPLCPVSLDIDARELIVADERIAMAPLEFAVLHYLVEREGKAVSRAALLTDVWGYEYVGGSNVVDAVVRVLRKKLGAYAGAIETVTKVGYRFRYPAPGRSWNLGAASSDAERRPESGKR